MKGYSNGPIATALEFDTYEEASEFLSENKVRCISQTVIHNQSSGKFELVIGNSFAESLGLRNA